MRWGRKSVNISGGDFFGTEVWENFGAISSTDLTPRNATINYGDILSGREGGGGDLSFIQGATQGFPSCPMFVICSRFDHRRQGQPTNEKRKLVIIDTRSHILLPFIAFETLKIFHP